MAASTSLTAPVPARVKAVRLTTLTGIGILILLYNCLSIEVKLTQEKIYQQRKEASEIEVLILPPEVPAIKTGQLSILYNTGYQKEKILNLLKKKAAELGADAIYIKKIKKVADSWLIKTTESAVGYERGYQTKQKKIKMTVDMFRYKN